MLSVTRQPTSDSNTLERVRADRTRRPPNGRTNCSHKTQMTCVHATRLTANLTDQQE